ncbi:13449_t:CDS:2, partial [Racocetra persica]
KNPSNPTNALAICNWCIAKNSSLEAAKIKPECKEIEQILSLPDNDKIFVPVIKQGQSSTTFTIARSGSSTSSPNQLITKFLCHPLSSNNRSHFEELLLQMIVSNALPFTFVENEEILELFQFIAPELELPKRKVISDKVLIKSAQTFCNDIIKVASSDMDRVTAVLDG